MIDKCDQLQLQRSQFHHHVPNMITTPPATLTSVNHSLRSRLPKNSRSSWYVHKKKKTGAVSLTIMQTKSWHSNPQYPSCPDTPMTTFFSLFSSELTPNRQSGGGEEGCVFRHPTPKGSQLRYPSLLPADNPSSERNGGEVVTDLNPEVQHVQERNPLPPSSSKK